MTAQVGRAVLLQILVGTEYTTIAALISKSLTLNKEPVDITSDDDAGWRTLLEDIDGTKSVDIACEGILKTNQVGLLCEGASFEDLRFDVPSVRRYDGAFCCTSFEIGAETAEGVTFSASFQSTGPVTFAASP
jgi:TP901-1 family phage major tail protein